MICAYLVHCGLFDNTQEALEFYGHARTMNGKGVTIPSQVRYVHYYARFVKNSLRFEPVPLLMKSVIFYGIPDFSNGTCIPQFILRYGFQNVLIFKSGFYEGIQRDQDRATLELSKHTPVCGDVKIEFIHRKGNSGKEKMFHLWFNTFFVDGHRFVAHQPEIDKANKDKKNKIYPYGFWIEILFGSIDQSEDGASSRGASGDAPPKLTHRDSNLSQAPEWSDSDLTTTDEDEDEWEGLPISDV
jgi:phosphatidylinositol-3,4,5-trisphosphate 3-phosphatase/dual-specificity protein phosphatase PTEN